MSEKKYEAQRKALLASPKNGYDCVDEATRKAIFDYAEDYKRFLDAAKTEREAVTDAICRAEAAGFRAWERGMALQPGDKVYVNNRGKAIMLAVIGENDLSHGANICAAHAWTSSLTPSMRTASWPISRRTTMAALKSISGPPSRWPCTVWWR